MGTETKRLSSELLEHRMLETISEWLCKSQHRNVACHDYTPAKGLVAALWDAGLEVVERQRG